MQTYPYPRNDLERQIFLARATSHMQADLADGTAPFQPYTLTLLRQAQAAFEVAQQNILGLRATHQRAKANVSREGVALRARLGQIRQFFTCLCERSQLPVLRSLFPLLFDSRPARNARWRTWLYVAKETLATLKVAQAQGFTPLPAFLQRDTVSLLSAVDKGIEHMAHLRCNLDQAAVDLRQKRAVVDRAIRELRCQLAFHLRHQSQRTRMTRLREYGFYAHRSLTRLKPPTTGNPGHTKSAVSSVETTLQKWEEPPLPEPVLEKEKPKNEGEYPSHHERHHPKNKRQGPAIRLIKWLHLLCWKKPTGGDSRVPAMQKHRLMGSRVFLKTYQQQPDAWSVQGYNTIKLLDHGMSKAPSTKPNVIADAKKPTRSTKSL